MVMTTANAEENTTPTSTTTVTSTKPVLIPEARRAGYQSDPRDVRLLSAAADEDTMTQSPPEPGEPHADDPDEALVPDDERIVEHEEFDYFSPEGLKLGEDPDTAMVDSLPLHLISEHDVPDSLCLSADDAASLHEHLHLQQDSEHAPHDLRFRVRRGLRAVMADIEMSHALQHGALSDALIPGLTDETNESAAPAS